MTDRHEAIKEGVQNSMDFWFSQHPISMGELIQNAVKEAFGAWLDVNAVDVLEAIEKGNAT
jgi:hypothetical protein